MALIFSLMLHIAIIFLTTLGQGAKVKGKLLFKEFQVDIIDYSPSANNIPQQQDKSAPKLKESAIDHGALQPEPAGAIPINEEPYYTVKELDVVPRPILSIMPRFPESVPPSIRRGMVKLEIKLNEEGLVTEVTVLGSEPAGYFESAAREAFLDARFTPGIKSGRHVRALLTIQVHFENPNNL